MRFDKKQVLAELDIPEEFYKKLLTLFLEQAEEQILKLPALIQNKDFGKMADFFHLIKGAAANLRILEIQELAERLERVCEEEKNLQVIEEGLCELKRLLEATKALMTE